MPINKLILGDNLEILNKIDDESVETVKLKVNGVVGKFTS